MGLRLNSRRFWELGVCSHDRARLSEVSARVFRVHLGCVDARWGLQASRASVPLLRGSQGIIWVYSLRNPALFLPKKHSRVSLRPCFASLGGIPHWVRGGRPAGIPSLADLMGFLSPASPPVWTSTWASSREAPRPPRRPAETRRSQTGGCSSPIPVSSWWHWGCLMGPSSLSRAVTAVRGWQLGIGVWERMEAPGWSWAHL